MLRKLILLILTSVFLPIYCQAGEFTDNGNGTIQDLRSGLMWQQTDDGIAKSWPDALNYCNSLVLSGYSDWRLPNVKELVSILDISPLDIDEPAIDNDYFIGTQPSYYWTSTSVADGPVNAWYVSFYGGGIAYGQDKRGPSWIPIYCRCVRLYSGANSNNTDTNVDAEGSSTNADDCDDNDSDNHPDPTGSDLDFTAKTFDGGREFSAGIYKGALYTMGNNGIGYLGDGTTVAKYIPTKIGDDNDWASVATARYTAYAIKSDGSLWAWGYNSYGQLGNGTTDDSLVPIQVGVNSDWAIVSSHTYHTLALKTDGSLWAWGTNAQGRLGNGTTDDSLVPIQVGVDTDWVLISAGGDYSIAKKTDGTLWGWGDNSYGQLGQETTVPILAPMQIGEDNNWAYATANDYYGNLAIKTDGTLWVWGDNGSGELSGNLPDVIRVPTQIGTDKDWAMVDGGNNSSIALKSDGTLWGFGSDYLSISGAVGPTQIGIDDDWASISCGYYHNHAFKTDGSLYGWGDNSYGSLGNGTTYYVETPSMIGTITDWTLSE
jgi:alpha-tubulin suppressor-like RCC1 family protein